MLMVVGGRVQNLCDIAFQARVVAWRGFHGEYRRRVVFNELAGTGQPWIGAADRPISLVYARWH